MTLVARWGEQLDVRHIGAGSGEELTEEQVAGYIAKYATKATEALGVTLDHRLSEAELDDLDVPAHVAELVRACFELGARPSLAPLRLRNWAPVDRGGVAGCLGGRSGARSAADRQGGATNHHQGSMNP